MITHRAGWLLGARECPRTAACFGQTWYFEPADPSAEGRAEAVKEHVGIACFLAAIYLLTLFVTASWALTGSGPVRWDRGFKSTICVLTHISFEGCTWELVMEERSASGSGN